MSYTDEELLAMANDTRKKLPNKWRVPKENIASGKMSRLVAEATGFQYQDTHAILHAYFKEVSKQLHEKKLVEIPGIGSFIPIVRTPRVAINFKKESVGPSPTRMITKPRISIRFRPSTVLTKTVKELPVSREEIEAVYTRK